MSEQLYTYSVHSTEVNSHRECACFPSLHAWFFWYIYLENSPENAHALIVKNHVCIDGDTELARAVDVVMARAKRIYILIIKVNKLFSFFSSCCFLKEIENVYSMFLSSYTNTSGSLGEGEMLWEHEPQASVPKAFLVLPNFHSCLYNSIETWSTHFLFLKYTHVAHAKRIATFRLVVYL